MDKELIDKAWACLPREFREEVKKEYLVHHESGDMKYSYGYSDALTDFFGHHNLTSDVEGEEMLTVEANLVKELYQRAKEIEEESKRIYSPLVAAKYCGVQRAIEDLFGSKCLPNEEQPKQKDCDNPLADKEGCKWRNDGKCAFDSACYFEPLNPQEPKPAEPKFKRGDKAKIVGGNPEFIGKVVEIEAVDSKGTIVVYLPNAGHSTYKKDYLEPYTEPTAKNPKEPAKTFASDEPTATETDDFDRIVNDRFRSHNRLHIAAMAMQGILGNADRMKSYEQIAMSEPYDDLPAVVARNAVRYANALIAETEKGGAVGNS